MSKQKMAKAREITDSREEEIGSAPEAAEQTSAEASASDEPAPHTVQNIAERLAIIEALIFVSDEPLSAKTIAEVLKDDREVIEAAAAQLADEFNSRNGGLQ